MKPWYKSKTMIVNVAVLLAMVFGSSELQAVLPENAWEYVVQAQAVINIVLRFVTNTGIKS